MSNSEVVVYTCSHCRKTFRSDWSNAEAIAEHDRLFPGDMTGTVVCDDCFKAMTAILPPEEFNRWMERCGNCGLTKGSHHAGYTTHAHNLCPGHEADMDWDNSPGTTFVPTGEFVAEPIKGKLARNGREYEPEILAARRQLGLHE